VETYVYAYECLHLYVRNSMYPTLTCIDVYTYKHMYIYGIFICLLQECCSDLIGSCVSAPHTRQDMTSSLIFIRRQTSIPTENKMYVCQSNITVQK